MLHIEGIITGINLVQFVYFQTYMRDTKCLEVAELLQKLHIKIVKYL